MTDWNQNDNQWEDEFKPEPMEGGGWQPEPSIGGEGEAGADWSMAMSKHANGDDFGSGEGGPVGGGACRNCGEEGHFSRECPEPKKMTGECYNCGEVGHNKADCPNPHVDRPFTGTCNLCGETGHRRAECPQKPAPFCKNCRQEGHFTEACESKRALVFNTPPMEPDEVWQQLTLADKQKDTTRFRDLLWEYGRVTEVNLDEVEDALRTMNMNHHLVAIETELPKSLTHVDIQGNTGRKYGVHLLFSLEPRRKKFARGYPATQEENMERLKDAGFSQDTRVMICSRCSEVGHTAKFCKQEREVRERTPRLCAICGSDEHITRACKEERKKPSNACRRCGEEGHKAADCTNEENPDLFQCRECNEMGHKARDCPSKVITCRNCGEDGHMSRECPTKPAMTCRNCGEEGHMGKDCDKPRVMKCRNCDEVGHMSKECPKPTDWSRVKCRNCGELGHGPRRCPQPPKEEEPAPEGDGGVTLGDDNTFGTEATGNWGAAAADDTGAGDTGGNAAIAMDDNW